MGKVVKYEWRKQMSSKIVIAGILIGLTIIFAIGTFAEKENWMQFSLIALVVCGMFSAMFVGVESLLVLNRDLRTKESHMLFMVPLSSYKILGGKMIAAFLQIILTAAMFAGAFALCFTAFLSKNMDIAMMLDMITDILNDTASMEISWKTVALAVGQILTSWIFMIASGYTAIIAVRTVLVKSKFATPISIVVFLLINYGSGKLTETIMKLSDTADMDYLLFGLVVLIDAVLGAALLLLAGWMAERKLSV